MEHALRDRMHRRIQRLAALLAGAAAAALLLAPLASAHISYDGYGRFMHEAHQRHLYFISSVDGPRWRAQTRDAQVHWDSYMDGILGFETASSHDYAKIGAEDADYGPTGWVGFAQFWGYHVGHGHVLLNTYYPDRTYYSDNTLQNVACHETGHFTGLAHTTNATDCMITPANGSYPTIGSAHRDQLRSAWGPHPAFP